MLIMWLQLHTNVYSDGGSQEYGVYLLNSVYFVQPIRTNSKCSSGFTVCTQTTSLSQDLTSDQNNSQQIEKTLSLVKGEKPSGEQRRRVPLHDGQKQEMSCDQEEALQSYNTFNEYDGVYE